MSMSSDIVNHLKVELPPSAQKKVDRLFFMRFMSRKTKMSLRQSKLLRNDIRVYLKQYQVEQH